MQQLLRHYGDAFSYTSGTAHWIKHEIKVTDEIPYYQTSYRVPGAMRNLVEKELIKMLNSGIMQYDYNTRNTEE